MAQLAAFDMDGTLLDGRLVFALAERFGLDGKVRSVQADSKLVNYEKTIAIAALFAGLTRQDLLAAIESVPLAANCERAISLLKEQGWKVGIITDSYATAASVVAERLRMDFLAANELEFKGDKITGTVHMPLGWQEIGCTCKLSVCKRFHLEKYATKFGVPLENTAAIGDTRADICMVRRAGAGIAFMPKDDDIASATKSVVRKPDMMQVAQLLLLGAAH
ncbi:haloacid dehalogenase superfamily protein, subfamily IB, phosphoserine phosphatase [Candidatus Nitrososphaera evergladensis SR1]|uniref:phosphoserine phosphatase n=1 Tax=Candidatus Nitrososphaera evergladensis SR1 TaxID=1459636 RepID=A0A075MU87_9ARCH|nr:HAD-IB family phosphatase [Candidatus Nitrososphaera evergladensis]AIF82899.1 haloacid dehalogenase superfamily protein, subfamily IB, phosphoserine phosphatase [Candidatus Nitrososphaera evergladensis SR1]